MTEPLLPLAVFTALFLLAAGHAKGASVEAKSAAMADIKSAIAAALVETIFHGY